MRKLLLVLLVCLAGCQTTVHHVNNTELSVETIPPEVEIDLSWNLPTLQEMPFEILTMHLKVEK